MRTSTFAVKPAVLFLVGATALGASQVSVDKALRKYENARSRLAAEINQVRAEEDLEPLALEDRLTRAAQEVALSIALRMKAHETFEEAVHDDEVEERLAAAGYGAHAYAVRFAVIAGEPREVAVRLTAGGRELRRTDLPELGIGIAPSFRSRIYVVVVAQSADEPFANETAEDAARAAGPGPRGVITTGR